jgi:hypothetical protein
MWDGRRYNAKYKPDTLKIGSDYERLKASLVLSESRNILLYFYISRVFFFQSAVTQTAMKIRVCLPCPFT